MKDPKNHQRHVKRKVLRETRRQAAEFKGVREGKMESEAEGLEEVQLKVPDEHQLRATKRNVHKPRRNWQLHPRYH